MIHEYLRKSKLFMAEGTHVSGDIQTSEEFKIGNDICYSSIYRRSNSVIDWHDEIRDGRLWRQRSHTTTSGIGDQLQCKMKQVCTVDERYTCTLSLQISFTEI